MPDSAPSICRQPGCPQLTTSGYCELHTSKNASLQTNSQRQAKRRDSELLKLYDKAAWRRARRFVLSRDPICEIGIICGGQSVSTDVDHKIRAEIYIAQHDRDESYFFDPNNLQGSCHACHTHKTSLENKGQWVDGKHS